MPVSGDTYAIDGLGFSTAAEGNYTLSVNADNLLDEYGLAGTGTVSTSWLMDTTPPTSNVSPLSKTGTSLTFPVTITGTDPNGTNGSTGSGIAFFTLYQQVGSAWQVVPGEGKLAPTSTSDNTASVTVSFTGQSNTSYSFYATATDAAGNTTRYSPSIQAYTYLLDLTPPVTSVNPTTGNNATSVNPYGAFTLNLTGTAQGGKPLAYFEVFVGIDLGSGGSTQQVGVAIPAGFADVNGVYHATITYQGLTDGASHTYKFWSIDGAGQTQGAAVNPVTFSDQSFTASALQVTAFTVENGASERSYIRYLGVSFNERDTQSGGQLTALTRSLGPAVRLYKDIPIGSFPNPTPVSLAGVTVSVIDHAIELDFGAGGIGNGPNTTAADGYYELDVTVGGTTSKVHFFRLLGDVTGDGGADNSDLAAIASELALSAPAGYTPLSGDVNGDGTVTQIDSLIATRSKGYNI